MATNCSGRTPECHANRSCCILQIVTGEVEDGAGGAIHDRSEIDQALCVLGEAGIRRLARLARGRIRRFGLDPARHSPQELLSEAVSQTLSGRRSWRKGVDFDRHLRLVMRSIAASWRRSAARAAAARAREVRLSELWAPGEKVDPKDLPDSQQAALASPAPGPEAELITRERIEAVVSGCADDEPASLLIACWAEDLDGREMRRRLEVTKRQLKTTKERVRRKARRIEAGDAE